MTQGLRYKRTLRRAGGFTLLELMVTVAVLAIVAGLAAPSFRNVIQSNRLVSSSNEMVAMLQAARLAAVSSRINVTVCPTADGSTCTASAGNHWIALGPGAAGVLREIRLHPSVAVKASPSLVTAGYRMVFGPNGFSRVGTGTGGSVGLCIAGLSGNNSADVGVSAGRISTVRRQSATCSAPGG